MKVNRWNLPCEALFLQEPHYCLEDASSSPVPWKERNSDYIIQHPLTKAGDDKELYCGEHHSTSVFTYCNPAHIAGKKGFYSGMESHEVNSEMVGKQYVRYLK